MAAHFTAVYEGGLLRPTTPLPLEEGARVEILVLQPQLLSEAEGKKPTLAELLKYAGILQDMPSDFAQQHDHYIHGTPKR